MPSYIIDRDYRLLYFDSVTKLRFPKVTAGEVCYRVFNKTENPCRGCRCFQYDSEKRRDTIIEMWNGKSSPVLRR